MIPTRKVIELREGVTCEVLVTPALYGVATRRGVDVRPAGDTPADIVSSYARLLFCAAINAWEVRTMDEPGIGDFPFRYADFDDWAWRDRQGFGEAMRFAYTALTGKTLREGTEEEVKKKEPEEVTQIDYAPIEDFLVGTLGMSQREAAQVSLPEFTQRQRGWERAERAKWELARWAVWHEYILSPYIKPGRKPHKPSDILHLEGDQKPKEVTREQCHITENEASVLAGIFDRLKQKQNG